MGNCQAIDAATLVIQHPNGKVEKMYWSVPASEIMKLNPGHYVALLITTTICHTSPKTDAKSPTKTNNNNSNNSNSNNNSDNKKNDGNKNNSNSPKNSSNSKKNSSNNSNSSKNSSTGTGTVAGAGAGAGDSRNTVRITRVKLLRPTDTLALGHVYRLISSQEVMKGLVAKKQAKMRKNGIELADSEGLKEAEKLVKRSQQEKNHQYLKKVINGNNLIIYIYLLLADMDIDLEQHQLQMEQQPSQKHGSHPYTVSLKLQADSGINNLTFQQLEKPKGKPLFISELNRGLNLEELVKNKSSR
ncbi:hypothetical protein RDABS01_019087 [Bienertia sinuspersici]